MTNLSTNLVAAAQNYPDRTALRCDGTALSFAEFNTAAARVATFLDHAGIVPGDRVGIMLPNSAAFAVTYYGIMGARGPAFKSCEVRCDKKACPKGRTCVTVSDGPGRACR